MTGRDASLALATSVAALALVTGPLPGPVGPVPASAQGADCSTDTAKPELTDEQVKALYDCVSDALLAGYQGSGVEAASAFRGWTRASTMPFISATHGGRYVQHYINGVGEDVYLQFEAMSLDPMPVGSFAAKESFSINDEGKAVPGPLFLMEKVAAGELPDTGDWRYGLILPNGQIMGTSGGENGDKVQFCHGCHQRAPENQDALLLPKKPYRVEAR